MKRITPALVALSVLGCSKPPQRRPLEDQLAKEREKDRSETPPEVARLCERQAKELKASGIRDRIRKPGAPAPDFTLPDAAGNKFSLQQLLREGPVVLVFYRGHW